MAGDARTRRGTTPPPGADLAYGAFQRGYYLSAFSLAIPRAEAGDTAAQTLLGLIYEGGYGVPRDPAQAANWYQFAADGGDAEGAVRARHRCISTGAASPPTRRRRPTISRRRRRAATSRATYNLGAD